MNFVLIQSLTEKCASASCDSSGDLAIILLAMLTQAPGGTLEPMSMLPILLMSEKSNNQDLILFMEIARQRNKQSCVGVMAPYELDTYLANHVPDTEHNNIQNPSDKLLVKFLTKTPERMSPRELERFLEHHVIEDQEHSADPKELVEYLSEKPENWTPRDLELFLKLHVTDQEHSAYQEANPSDRPPSADTRLLVDYLSEKTERWTPRDLELFLQLHVPDEEHSASQNPSDRLLVKFLSKTADEMTVVELENYLSYH